MLIIPAIDLMDGKVVRLTKGDFTTSKIYSSDPVRVALDWQGKGVKRIHIVDLDGAKTGKCQNLNVVKKITEELTIPVQLGGGIRSLDMVQKVLDSGAKWIILGTSAFEDEEFLKGVVSSFPDRIIVSVDIKDEKIYIKGWKESSSDDIFTFFEKLKGMKISSLIVTDIRKDGTLKGVNVKLFTEICKHSPIPIIVAGGISSLEDIKRLSAVKKIEGIIIGKALYEDRIDLEEAIEEISDKR
ncbi:MAG: 1-(5-phosphoribosyl)-5-[(5-phosphoribosylamino)methylideneamino]imidazole-4-carboxamide isomerase [Candidatus Ratteibacteria bacterium]|nr:1-(5-phosphoribosyl)-5-[(5-phosphoribosylamino)methylideneamino]imidazole-4-carboxamide isomerase [Candidatus Ratteibacteria bacterium]